MKKQKLIAVSILFALISATAFNYAVAQNAFSDLQGAAKDSNTTIAFDGSKVYSNTASDSVVEFEYPDNYDENDYDQTETLPKELENNAAKNFSTAAPLDNSKILSKKIPSLPPTLSDSDQKNIQPASKPWKDPTPKQKTAIKYMVFGGLLGLAIGGTFAAIAMGAAVFLNLYFLLEW